MTAKNRDAANEILSRVSEANAQQKRALNSFDGFVTESAGACRSYSVCRYIRFRMLAVSGLAVPVSAVPDCTQNPVLFMGFQRSQSLDLVESTPSALSTLGSTRSVSTLPQVAVAGADESGANNLMSAEFQNAKSTIKSQAPEGRR